MISKYPGILRAALEIAYDNGGINRYRTESDHATELTAYLYSDHGYSPDELAAINKWLADLSHDELNTTCCAEESEQQSFMIAAKAPPKTNDLLNDIFEKVG